MHMLSGLELLPHGRHLLHNYYFTQMCSASEAGSYRRLQNNCFTGVPHLQENAPP